MKKLATRDLILFLESLKDSLLEEATSKGMEEKSTSPVICLKRLVKFTQAIS